MKHAPPYVPGHQLLVGKSVLITAAAGAGIGYSAARRSDEEWSRVLDVTLTGTFRMTRAMLPHMLVLLSVVLTVLLAVPAEPLSVKACRQVPGCVALVPAFQGWPGLR